jgi:hypothetical protein
MVMDRSHIKGQLHYRSMEPTWLNNRERRGVSPPVRRDRRGNAAPLSHLIVIKLILGETTAECAKSTNRGLKS